MSVVATALVACGENEAPAPAPAPRASSPEDVATISLIMVVYRSATKPEWPRSQDEARARAEEAVRRLRAGESMETLTRELTDDVDEETGTPFNGGTYTISRRKPGAMHAVKDVVFALKPGELMPRPVDTGLAYLVIRREH